MCTILQRIHFKSQTTCEKSHHGRSSWAHHVHVIMLNVRLCAVAGCHELWAPGWAVEPRQVVQGMPLDHTVQVCRGLWMFWRPPRPICLAHDTLLQEVRVKVVTSGDACYVRMHDHDNGARAATSWGKALPSSTFTFVSSNTKQDCDNWWCWWHLQLGSLLLPPSPSEVKWIMH